MKNKINMVLGLFVMAALTFSFSNIVSAYTYEYVNSSGQIDTVVAGTATEALDASNLAMHSGVILVGSSNNTPTVINNNQVQYMYVNDSGVVIGVNANSSNQAFAYSNNISTHSGVMIVNSASDQMVVGDSVQIYGR